MTASVEGGATEARSTRVRTVGASPLTQRIYRAVVKAGRPVTAREIYEQIKDVPGFRTDTSLWWQGRKAKRGGTMLFIPAEAGLRRVRERVNHLVKQGILDSDGEKGRGFEARYAKGERPPSGFRKHLHPGESFGWYPVDIAAEDQQMADRQALYELRGQVQAELAKPKIVGRMRQMLSEVDRFLGRVNL